MRKFVGRTPTRSLRSLSSNGRSCRRTGLTLVEVVLALLTCVLILVTLQMFGFTTVVTAFRAGAVILTLTVLWGLAYLRAPDLTRNGTVLLIIGMLTLSFVPTRALHMRETARRQTAVNHLRQIGQIHQALHDTGTPGNFENHLRDYQRSEASEAGTVTPPQ